MREQLIKNLVAVGKSTEVYQTPDGTEVLLLPYGGRVLGLFAPKSEENFYWTNTALDSPETAEKFYASDEWHNSGGDRTWLSPEVDLFLPEFPKLDKYFQQRSLDPGKYELVRTVDGPKLVNKLKIELSRLKTDLNLVIKKSFGPAPNPLRYERGIDLSDVEYAGYTQYTSIEILGGMAEDKAAVGLWNLIQMPHGGQLMVPTYGKTEPKIIFGTIPQEDLTSQVNLVRYRMNQVGEHKIGIRAVATTGRVGYIYEAGNKWALIVRNFTVNPSGEYVDVPWDDTSHLGYSTQACNVNSNLGCFSELEYHIPAIGCGTGRCKCNDEAQTWAFRGAKDAIYRVAGMLIAQDI